MNTESPRPDAPIAVPGGRDRAVAIAYHVLGSVSDAEDVAQDAAAAWLATDPETVEDPEAWIAVVTTRRAIDRLRERDRRRETYVGPWLPEPRVHAVGSDPADSAATADEVSYALLVVLDRLTPEQRVAFVLHDVFGEPFDRVGQVLGRNPAAARQLASRARRRVRDAAPPSEVDDASRWALVEAFLDACDHGDHQRLLSMLAPEAELVTDGGGVVTAARNVVVGADRVARFLLGVWTGLDPSRVDVVSIGGDPGVVVRADGRTTVAVPEVRHGLVTSVRIIANPDKLRHLDPAP